MKKAQVWIAFNKEIEEELFIAAPEEASVESIFTEANLRELWKDYPIEVEIRIKIEKKERQKVKVELVNPEFPNYPISFNFFQIGGGIITE